MIRFFFDSQNRPLSIILIELVTQLSRSILGGEVGFGWGRGRQRDAIQRGLEEGEGEALVDNADVKVDETGAGDVDADAEDGEPEEELLGGDAWEGGDLAVGERAGDGGVEADLALALELGRARRVQPDLEPPVAVDLEILHPFRQQPHRQAMGFQHLVRTHRSRRPKQARNREAEE